MDRIFNNYVMDSEIESCRKRISVLQHLQKSIQAQGIVHSNLNNNTWKEILSELPSKKASAVLVAICQEEDGLNMLFTVRSEKVALHSGEICFPGGKREASDLTPTDTALREAYEEIGLLPDDVDVLEVLPPLTGYWYGVIFAVIGIVKKPFVPKINLLEVQELFSVPFCNFLTEASTFSFRSRDNLSYKVCIADQTYHIWGLTHMMALTAAFILCDHERPINKNVAIGFTQASEIYSKHTTKTKLLFKYIKDRYFKISNL